jgi:dephospho-CoA kinase
LESAIILETPFASTVDKMATVSAPVALRLERLCNRDKASVEDARRRMEKQWSDAEREAKSDYVIHSDGKTPLLPRILTIHHKMLELSK